MKTLCVAIVDDEPLARQRLRRLLLEVGGASVAIALECADAEELLERAGAFELDVLFLDVEMPGGNAFQLLERWRGPRPTVVFVTAYDAYGVRAFDARVFDYLMKPVSAERLQEPTSFPSEGRHSCSFESVTELSALPSA